MPVEGGPEVGYGVVPSTIHDKHWVTDQRLGYEISIGRSIQSRTVYICNISSKTDNGGYLMTINPHLPNGLSHPDQLDESIYQLRGVWCTCVIFIIFVIEIPVSKLCRP